MRLEGKMKGRLFFFVCEIMRDILQAGVLLATAFSDILCFDVPKCCVASNYTVAPNIFCLQSINTTSTFLLKHISKLGQLICTEKSAGECVLCVFLFLFFPSLLNNSRLMGQV